jgi:hypothetical protein
MTTTPTRLRPGSAHRDLRPLQEHGPGERHAELLLQLRGRLEDVRLLHRVPHVFVHVPGRGRRAPSGPVVRGGRLRRGHERERAPAGRAYVNATNPRRRVQHGPALGHDHAAERRRLLSSSAVPGLATRPTRTRSKPSTRSSARLLPTPRGARRPTLSRRDRDGDWSPDDSRATATIATPSATATNDAEAATPARP